MGAISPVLGCDLGGASGGTRSGGCGLGKVGVGLPKWGLGYVSLGSLDVDRSSWWCAILPMLGCDEPVLVCDLRGASGGATSPVLVCDLSSLLFLSLFYFPGSRIDLKVKYKRKWFYRVRGHILRSTEMIFRLTQFSLHTQTPAFTEKYFRK